MAMRSLFACGVPRDCSVFRMEGDDPDHESAAKRYGDLLPDKIDVMLFGVGDDGHIASMFPRRKFLRETRRKVEPVTGPSRPANA
jgi:6-phosphogluconolactonase